MVPVGWISKKLWELTYWDKRFNGVDKSKQKKILTFKHVLAEKLKSLCVRDGTIKLLATGKFDGYTTEELAQNDVNYGEVLTLPSGGAAAIKYFDGAFVDSGNIIAQTSDKEQYCLKFIYYYLMSINNLIEKEYRGTGIKHPYMPAILDISIPVPSLLEQQQIIKKIDTLFADIEKEKQIAQQSLQKIKELFESELHKLFTENTDGWVEKDFERCIKPVTYTNKIQRKNFLGSGKFPIVSQEDTLINGYWNEDVDVFKIDQPVVIFGDHTKKIKYIDFDFVLGADGVKVLVPIAEIIPKYFYYCLQSIKIRDLGYARHYRLLKEKTIKYPDLQAQKEIIKKLDALQEQTQELEQIHTQQIADLDELKQAILKKAFNGEL